MSFSVVAAAVLLVVGSCWRVCAAPSCERSLRGGKEGIRHTRGLEVGVGGGDGMADKEARGDGRQRQAGVTHAVGRVKRRKEDFFKKRGGGG